MADLPLHLLPRLHRSSLSRLMASSCVPTVLSYRSAGISTCCPSATPFGLALGPRLTQGRSALPGNLGYSAGGFSPLSRYSFRHSLFLSLHRSFRYGFFAVYNAPLPIIFVIPKLRCRVSAPDIFGAGPLD